MGKKDFQAICRQAKLSNGSLTIKLSYFCDTYSSTASYAGIIVYAVDGKFQWTSASGDTKGHGGKTFYVGILDTAKYPAGELTRDVGQGRVHHYIIRKLLGREFSQDTVCCGGFAILKSTVHYSSVWLNQRDQYPKEGFGKSDGSKYLASLEQELVLHTIQQWAVEGANKILSLPSALESKLTKVEYVSTTTARTGYSTRVHSHPLYCETRTGWICDGTRMSSGCRRGTTKESGANGYPRYRCDMCDFDLCDQCLVFYK